MEKHTHNTGQMELISRRECLQLMSDAELLQLKAESLEELSQLEREVHAINDILDHRTAYPEVYDKIDPGHYWE